MNKPHIQGILLLLATVIFSQNAHAVFIGDKQWRQLSETTNFSFNELSSGPCNSLSGSCRGIYNGVDFNGWVWATREEVGKLFELLIPTNNVTFEAGAIFNEQNSVWAPSIIDIDGLLTTDTGIFFSTSNQPYAQTLWGISRTIVNWDSLTKVVTPTIVDITDPNQSDFASTKDQSDTFLYAKDNRLGVWMYRYAVNEPNSIWMFLLGASMLLINKGRYLSGGR